MGGAIALLLGTQLSADDKKNNDIWQKWRGEILIAPYIVNTIEPNFLVVKTLLGMRSLFGPRTWGVGPRIDPPLCTRIKEKWDNYFDDPLFFSDKMRLSTAYSLYLLKEPLVECLKVKRIFFFRFSRELGC